MVERSFLSWWSCSCGNSTVRTWLSVWLPNHVVSDAHGELLWWSILSWAAFPLATQNVILSKNPEFLYLWGGRQIAFHLFTVMSPLIASFSLGNSLVQCAWTNQLFSICSLWDLTCNLSPVVKRLCCQTFWQQSTLQWYPLLAWWLPNITLSYLNGGKNNRHTMTTLKMTLFQTFIWYELNSKSAIKRDWLHSLQSSVSYINLLCM